MNTLNGEVNRIRNELADLGCQMTFGMSCSELAEKIIKEAIENAVVAELEYAQH